MQYLGAREDIGVVGFLGLVRTFVRGGVEEDLFLAIVHTTLAEKAFEVVVKIGCVFFVGTHDEVLAAYLTEGFLHDKGL